ncbi:hypothetical protein D3C78_1968450 [compost metagenome]
MSGVLGGPVMDAAHFRLKSNTVHLEAPGFRFFFTDPAGWRCRGFAPVLETGLGA